MPNPMTAFKAIIWWLWRQISRLWRREQKLLPVQERRLVPDDCLVQGFTTLGNPLAPGSDGELVISSGSCRCRTPKFIDLAGYKAADANTLVEKCTPVPVLLMHVRVEGWPTKPSINTPLCAPHDSGLSSCVGWPAFSSIEDCRLVLSFRNVLNFEVHVFGKLYVMCEGGCCDVRPPNSPPPPALASYSPEGEV